MTARVSSRFPDATLPVTPSPARIDDLNSGLLPSPTRRRVVSAALAVSALPVLLGGCGGGDDMTSPVSTPSPAPAPLPPTVTPAPVLPTPAPPSPDPAPTPPAPAPQPTPPAVVPAAYTRAAGGIGEFLCPLGWDRLRSLASKDKPMADIMQVMKDNSAKLLARVPTPVTWLDNAATEEQPITHTLTETEKTAAKKAADDDFGAIVPLGYAWSYYQLPEQLQAVRRILLAWAAVNEPYGNPLADHKLLSPAKAYYQVRHALSAADRDVIDPWFRKMMVRNRQWVEKSKRNNNWHSHGICNAAVAALVIDDQEHLKWVENITKAHLAKHIEPGGATFDFRQRDALSYHNYSLEGLLMINQVLNIHGVDLYLYQAVSGAGTIKAAMDFLVPYIKGEKVHYEFVNTTYEKDITEIHKNEYNTRWKLEDIWAIRRVDAYDKSYGNFVRTLMKTTYPNNTLTWRFPEWHENYLFNEVTRDLKANPIVPA